MGVKKAEVKTISPAKANKSRVQETGRGQRSGKHKRNSIKSTE